MHLSKAVAARDPNIREIVINNKRSTTTTDGRTDVNICSANVYCGISTFRSICFVDERLAPADLRIDTLLISSNIHQSNRVLETSADPGLL